MLLDAERGAGGITEGFRQAGYRCLYGNGYNREAISTFALNHLGSWSEACDLEGVDPKQARARLSLQKGALDVLLGGPPCQGFSINAPERFLDDPRNKLFKDYLCRCIWKAVGQRVEVAQPLQESRRKDGCLFRGLDSRAYMPLESLTASSRLKFNQQAQPETTKPNDPLT